MDDISAKIKQTGVIDLEKEVLTKTASFLLGAFILTLVLMLGLGGWYLAAKNTYKNLDSKVKDLDSQLATLSDLEQEYNAFSGAVNNIQNALNQKKKWPYVFAELSNITPKDVVINNFSVDESGKAKIDATAPSLNSLAKAIVAFSHDKEDPKKANPVFKNTTLTGFSFGGGKGISFSLSMDIAPQTTKEQK